MTSLAIRVVSTIARNIYVFKDQDSHLLVHSIQFSGDVPGNQSGQHRGQVRLLDEQVLQWRPLPVQIATGCSCYYRNLSHMKELNFFLWKKNTQFVLLCQPRIDYLKVRFHWPALSISWWDSGWFWFVLILSLTRLKAAGQLHEEIRMRIDRYNPF